ncbi:MAG: transposase-like protein [Gammaproteobacteria bacterium]|jgi:transposase-like protein
MHIPNSIYARRRLPPEVIAHAVFVTRCFALWRDVEALLAERGVTVSYETISPPIRSPAIRRKNMSLCRAMRVGRAFLSGFRARCF